MDLIYLDFKRESIYFYLMRKAVFRKTIKEKKKSIISIAPVIYIKISVSLKRI